ncbi:Upstream activation factor subunit spp27 [Ananas comosus]|uniref:Upstream activation factor subunit spp27 n=1 Tax=Ananas comosus TaxID=4615 RepID=A0A199W309_ANACO|nr:Upstream activation factor subunit spp27 [Ananas comosus]
MAAAKASAASSSPAPAEAAAAVAKPKSSAFTKPMPLSPAMRKFVGVPEISRPEAVKKVWEHIKAHNLQDPANKKLIHCDEKLKTIFGGKETVGIPSSCDEC